MSDTPSTTTTTTTPSANPNPAMGFSFSAGRPSISRNSSYSSLLASSYGRSQEADERDNWAGALTLLDVVETFFDSRIDLLERRLRAHSRNLKAKATELIPRGLRTPRTAAQTPADELDEDAAREHGQAQGRDGEGAPSAKRYKREVEREVERIRLRVRRGRVLPCGSHS